MTPLSNFIVPNTLALSARARFFARYHSVSELLAWLAWAQKRQVPVLAIGAGSNVLAPAEVPALVLQSAMQQHYLLHSDKQHVWVVAEAGLNWHDWVLSSTEYGHGLENLALIPGSVGAAPIQNIGAYGVELADCLAWVEGIRLSCQQLTRWDNPACRFGYRDSVFKRELRGDLVITRVCFRLSRTFAPQLSYGPLAQWSAGRAVNSAELIDEVCRIRQSKLPDPGQLANAGSFFKNPVVSALQVAELLQRFPDMPHYPAIGGVKLAAGWLIERTGWKGKRLGVVGMHDQQALVLVNHGGARLADVEALSRQVQADVWSQFAVTLEPEPQRFAP